MPVLILQTSSSYRVQGIAWHPCPVHLLKALGESDHRVNFR